MITVETYAVLSVDAKNTDKKIIASFNNKVIKDIKDKNNIVKFDVVAPRGEGVYKMKVGGLNMDVKVVKKIASSSQTSVNPTSAVLLNKTKLSPLQKVWSWFN